MTFLIVMIIVFSMIYLYDMMSICFMHQILCGE